MQLVNLPQAILVVGLRDRNTLRVNLDTAKPATSEGHP
jgi:hypothetical protein